MVTLGDVGLMLVEWLCCEKLILDQSSLMGQIIEGDTDGLYLLVSSMSLPPHPPTQIFFRVSGSSVKLLIITSLTLYLNSLNIPIWILKAMLLNYLSQLSLYQFK